jgi:hypothetical protein
MAAVVVLPLRKKREKYATDNGGPLSMSSPRSKPEQSKSDSWLRQFWKDHQAVATIIAALVALFVGVTFQPIVNVFTNAPAGPTVVTSSPAPTMPEPSEPTSAPAPDPTPSINVRRSTGDKVLTLTADYSADLDSMPPGWGVKFEENDYKDIEVHHSNLVSENGDMAIVSGAPKYETCQDATAYQFEVEWRYVRPGLKVCVRTSENRYAFVTVKKFNKETDDIQLDVVVWDPPFE